MSSSMRGDGKRAGFTMIELLTVMGIIIILLSILLPVVAAVRKSGYRTDTTAEITRIAAACQNYYQDHSAYPGPVPEQAIWGYPPSAPPAQTPPTVLPNLVDLSGKPITLVTSSQNLLLGLLGGLKPTPGGTTFTFDPTLLTRGPQSLNPANPKQYTAYLDPKAGELTTDVVGNYVSVACAFPPTWPIGNPVPIGLTIPEFNDHFPAPAELVQQHPLIYLRARLGGVNAVLDIGAPASSTAEYYSAEMIMYGYVFPTPGDPANNTQVLYTASPLFFLNPTLNDGYTPRGKDTFMIISAGSDGLFGTSDDIVYPQN